MAKNKQKMRTISVKEYAEETGVPLATVYWQIHEGRLPKGVSFVRIGNTYIISIDLKRSKQTA